VRDATRYRPCVGAVIFNSEGKVWIGRRPGAHAPHNWQFPQGGQDKDETPEQSLWREMHEEIGLTSDTANILARTETRLTYDFPPHVLAKKRFNFIGQRQHWFALRLTGSVSFDFTHEDPPEFNAWRWADLHEAVTLCVPFKRHVYEAVAGRFLDYTHP